MARHTVKGYPADVEWRVRLRSGEIPGEVEDLVDLAEQLGEQLVEERVGFEEFGPSWWTTDGAVGLTVSNDLPDAREAIDWSRDVAVQLESALEVAGHPVGSPAWSSSPRMPTTSVEVVGATEGARILGVSRQRFYELQEQREDFPRPVQVLGRGSLWDAAELERWGKTRHRPPGRPPADKRNP